MNNTKKTKAKHLIQRFETLLDTWQREINYCKKETKEIKEMIK